ncbi:ABC-three component system middle component 6 [Neobacillus sp. PS2-9]|uniref:ABC-three component system middle component 6 n=1 Tax=Neobacillus sp. PS2-9 TaxID=3070676 RepID=UPI0027E0B046|nr:ABC-three component system middle component 6 [Neobacillus sp. PS2-9]WML58546.1 hypothetical protein RCG25_01775 [Neobacillus sp. PS2-9]
MILPNKFISLGNSLLGISSAVLLSLDKPKSINTLWKVFNKENPKITYDNFTLSLDLLYMLGLINLSDNYIELLEIEDSKQFTNTKHIKDIYNVFEIEEPNSKDVFIPYLGRLWEVLESDIA